MTNHFRTLLLNLSDLGDSTEYIAKGFVARPLSSKLQPFYNILFPANISRSAALKLAQAYLELIEGAGLFEATTLVDSRITYDLQTDFKNFKSSSIVISALNQAASAYNGTVQTMLSSPRIVDLLKYDNLWLHHYNVVYKLAGLIVAYVNRLQ